MIYHKNTKSDCPINAVNVLMNTVWEESSCIQKLDNIPFVYEYFKTICENEDDIGEKVYYSNLNDEQITKVKQMVIDYCQTTEKALEIIDYLEDSDGFDPVFFVLTSKNSEYIKFITRMDNRYECSSESASESKPEDEPESEPESGGN